MTATTSPPSGPPTLADLAGDPRRRGVERRVRLVLTVAATVSVVISALIIETLIVDAFGFLTSIKLSDLGDDVWVPRLGRYGVMAPIMGTVWVTVVATLVAAPIGLGAAIYLSEYANPKVRRTVKPIVEILASIPSVVVGYFAIRFIAPEITQRLFAGSPTKNLMVAGIGVGLLTIPLMTSVSEDALRAVPNSLREASYGLGARKVTTVTRVVVPAAISGLVAGLILSISRAIGETMVVFLAAGSVGTVPDSPLEPGTTITAAMAQVASGTDQVKGVGNAFQSIFFLGLLLFLITLLLNVVADRFVRRVRQKYWGCAMAIVSPTVTRDAVEAKLEGRSRDTYGTAFKWSLVACLVLVLGALIALIVSVSPEGLEVFHERGVMDFLLRPFSIRPAKTGVFQGIVGTVTCAVLVALVAFPLGVASAIYLEEYASDNWFTRLVDVVIRNLAGVPAVVYGLLGYAIFVSGPFESFTGGASVLSAGLTLAVLVLPIVVITSAEAIRAVPQSLREGGYGVGATRWEVTRTLVLPNAFGGILTGTILGLARALGEAAPLILVGAKQSGFSGGEWGDLTGPFTAMPMIISDWTSRPEALWNGVTQAAILVTLVLVLGINTAGILLRNRFDKKK